MEEKESLRGDEAYCSGECGSRAAASRVRPPLPTQRLHHKQLVGGEMWSTSACGQIVCKFFIFFFIQGDERLSIDWEKRDCLHMVKSAYLP